MEWPLALALGLSTLAFVFAGGVLLLLTKAGYRFSAMLRRRRPDEGETLSAREALAALDMLQARQKDLEKRLGAVARAQAQTAGQLQLLIGKLQRAESDASAEEPQNPPRMLH